MFLRRCELAISSLILISKLIKGKLRSHPGAVSYCAQVTSGNRHSKMTTSNLGDDFIQGCIENAHQAGPWGRVSARDFSISKSEKTDDSRAMLNSVSTRCVNFEPTAPAYSHPFSGR